MAGQHQRDVFFLKLMLSLSTDLVDPYRVLRRPAYGPLPLAGLLIVALIRLALAALLPARRAAHLAISPALRWE